MIPTPAPIGSCGSVVTWLRPLNMIIATRHSYNLSHDASKWIGLEPEEFKDRIHDQGKNPFEVIFKKTYDTYLKANDEQSGLKSYNEMVGLVINYHKNIEEF